MAILLQETSSQVLSWSQSVVYLNGFVYTCRNLTDPATSGVYKYAFDGETLSASSDFVSIIVAQRITTDGTYLWVLGRIAGDTVNDVRLFVVDPVSMLVIGYSEIISISTAPIYKIECDTLGWCHLDMNNSTWLRYKWTGSGLITDQTMYSHYLKRFDIGEVNSTGGGINIVWAGIQGAYDYIRLYAWDGSTVNLVHYLFNALIGYGEIYGVQFITPNRFVVLFYKSPSTYLRIFDITDTLIIDPLITVTTPSSSWNPQLVSSGRNVYILQGNNIYVYTLDADDNLVLVQTVFVGGSSSSAGAMGLYAGPNFLLSATDTTFAGVKAFKYVLNAQFTADVTSGPAPLTVNFKAI
jgi:hypothetical protein